METVNDLAKVAELRSETMARPGGVRGGAGVCMRGESRESDGGEPHRPRLPS